MVKEPRPGRVKTRLGRDLGYVEAAHWYRRTTLDTIRRLTNPRWDLILAVSPDKEGLTSRVWPRHIRRVPQGRGDLGVRMAALLRHFAPAPVCIIGSDIPCVQPSHIQSCFAGLGSHSAVIGPSEDGGYWTVGLRNSCAQPLELFNNVRWSTAHALTDTLASAPHLSWHKTQVLSDIDTIEDLRRWNAEKL